MARLRACLAVGTTLCLSAATAATATADHPRARPVMPGDLGVPGMSERQLRTFETEVLGPQHAAEHARQRKAVKAGDGAYARAARTADRAPAAQVSTDPAVSGRWGAPFSIPVMGIHAAMLPTGKVMWWSYPINPNPPYGNPSFPNTAQAWLWDPSTGATTRVDPPVVRDPDTGQMQPANIWCSGQSFLADGRLLVTGGNLRYKGNGTPPIADYAGLNKVYTFNPWTETWTEQPDMAKGRWYPSQVLMPDGRTAIMSGFDETGGGYASRNKDVELFTPSADMNGRGTMALLGVRESQGAPPDGGLYPHLAVMPSGRVIVAGPDLNDSWFLNDPGSPNVFGWTDFQAPSVKRLWGAGVLEPGSPGGSTRYTLLGGSDPDYAQNPPPSRTVATSETFDEGNTGAGWQPGASMNIPRSHLNTVLLPDESMVTVGGGVGTRPPEGQWAADPDQRQVELYDPQSGSWRLGAAQAESRAYHSTALLLPDGRVLSAGDDVNGGIDRDTAEIYEPPYLFKGPRPTISSAPAGVKVGQSFAVDTGGAAATRAVLVAPAATTHANDMSQRVVPLTATTRTGGLNLAAPPASTVAPPGYYMLFVLTDQGVPSVARWIKLEPPVTPPSGLVAAYAFNEGSGATVADSSGRGNGGTVGGASWIAGGKNGGALDFDGTNDLVTVADANSLDLTTAMTLEAWIKPRALGDWRTVLLKERPGSLTYALYGATDQVNRPNVEVGSTSLYGASALPVNAWSHLAATFDGATARLYVNGTQVGTKTTNKSMPTSSSPLRIGGNTVWNEWFNGAIDDLRIYNRALSAAEIAADRDTPVGGTPPPPPPDTTAPIVSVTAPAAGATVSGSVAVNAAASDNVGVTGVQFKVDGQHLGAEDTSAPYSVSWNSASASNGAHQLTAVARDAAGNTKTSTVVGVTVQNDTTAPNVSITAPAAGATLTGTVAVNGTASDNVGVSGVQFKLDGQNLGAEDTSAPYSVSWNTVTAANGAHQLTAVARDAAGNTKTSTVVGVTTQNDTTAPNVSITAPAAGAAVTGTVAVNGTASDNVGVSGVQFKLDGQNLGAEDASAPYSVSWNSATAANGAHQLTAVARDAAGNTRTSTVVGVTVQNAAPLPPGLVGAYSFNEGSGTLAADASSARNTGTLAGPAWTPSGKNGGALSFDGVNDWVTVPDALSLDLTSAISMSAWIRPTTGVDWRTVLIKENLTSHAYALYGSTDNGNRPDVEASSAALWGPSVLPNGSWTHLTATYGSGTMRLYVNGAQVATRSATLGLPITLGALRIGGNGIWGEYFHGLIDDVRVYNRALTATEVAADRDTPVPLGTP